MSVQQQPKKLQPGGGATPAPDFRELYSACHGRLLNSLTAVVRDRETAEDIAAQTFVKALMRRDSFRGDSSFFTWLFAIARNETRQHWSRRSAATSISLDAPDAPEMAMFDDDAESLERSDQSRRLRTVLRRLPAAYRRVLVDHFIHGYPVARIAARYRVPLGTVLSRIFKAKRLLRAAWEV